MELRQIRAFYEIAKIGSMSKASAVLNVSQPALSISLSKLEDEIGARLFSRDGRSMVLTETGEALLNTAEKMLFLEKEIIRIASNAKNSASELKIMARAAHPFIVSVVSKFHHDYPDVSIIFLHDASGFDSPDIIADATAVDPEVGMPTEVGSYIGQNDIIYKEDIVVAVPRILRPVCSSPFTLEDLLEYELIGLSSSYALGTIEEYYSMFYGLNLHHSIICDNSSVMRNLLMNGTGVAFVPSKTWLWQNNPALNLIPFEVGKWVRYVRIRPTHCRDYNRDMADRFMGYIARGFDAI